MKRNIVLAILAISLTGCMTAEMAKHESTEKLCLLTITHPKFTQVVTKELADRNASCDWEKVKILAMEEQRREMALANTISILNGIQAAQPKTTNIRANCNTFYSATGAQTVCY